jgi:hypothetical protein
MHIKYSVLFEGISHQIVLNLISDKEYCSEIIHCCKLKLYTRRLLLYLLVGMRSCSMKDAR